MKKEDVEKAAKSNLKLNYRIGKTMCRGQKLEDFGIENFIDGANWRINSVWHNPNEEPLVKLSLLIIEHINGQFELYFGFDPSVTKRWAYVKDLIPGNE